MSKVNANIIFTAEEKESNPNPSPCWHNEDNVIMCSCPWWPWRSHYLIMISDNASVIVDDGEVTIDDSDVMIVM